MGEGTNLVDIMDLLIGAWQDRDQIYQERLVDWQEHGPMKKEYETGGKFETKRLGGGP